MLFPFKRGRFTTYRADGHGRELRVMVKWSAEEEEEEEKMVQRCVPHNRKPKRNLIDSFITNAKTPRTRKRTNKKKAKQMEAERRSSIFRMDFVVRSFVHHHHVGGHQSVNEDYHIKFNDSKRLAQSALVRRAIHFEYFNFKCSAIWFHYTTILRCTLHSGHFSHTHISEYGLLKFQVVFAVRLVLFRCVLVV